jgi:peptide/nickel transport system ATP-binding protein
VAAVFAAPQTDYAARLLAAVPRPDRRLVDEASPPAAEPPLASLRDITVRYGRTSLLSRLRGRPNVVAGAQAVTLDIAAGEILGVVGESGSGKSTLARAMTGLAPFEGSLAVDGRTISGLADMDRRYRRAVQIVFQHPDASLNPRHRVRDILARPFVLYGRPEGRTLEQAIADLLGAVRLPPAYAERFPHQLSGGEKQRVAIARAFAARPRLVICDEVTSSLDVSVQAAVIELLLDLRRRTGVAYMFITHDINLVRQIAHRIAVMSRGSLVETIAAAELAGRGPSHPYTAALIAAVPTIRSAA